MVPIVLNWKDNGIVIWVSCEGTGFLMGDLFCGFRIEKQGAWNWETTKRFQKSVHPELWFSKNWPAIRIGRNEPGLSEVAGESDITLEALRTAAFIENDLAGSSATPASPEARSQFPDDSRRGTLLARQAAVAEELSKLTLAQLPRMPHNAVVSSHGGFSFYGIAASILGNRRGLPPLQLSITAVTPSSAERITECREHDFSRLLLGKAVGDVSVSFTAPKSNSSTK